MIWLLVIVPLAVAIASVLLIDREQVWVAVLLAVFAVFFLLLIRWFMALDVEVDAAAVRAAFGPFHKTVPIAQILSVSEEPYRWRPYGGWGIRLSTQKRQAWSVPFLKTGVEVHSRDGSRCFISSRDPGRLRSAIQDYLDRRESPPVEMA